MMSESKAVEIPGSVILEEELDPSYEPTEDDVLEYAKWLGLDLEEDADLLWIAREGLKMPLPPEWKPCQKIDDQSVYYYNFATKQSSWEHPCDAVIKQRYLEARAGKQRTQEGQSTPKKPRPAPLNASVLTGTPNSVLKSPRRSILTSPRQQMSSSRMSTHVDGSAQLIHPSPAKEFSTDGTPSGAPVVSLSFSSESDFGSMHDTPNLPISTPAAAEPSLHAITTLADSPDTSSPSPFVSNPRSPMDFGSPGIVFFSFNATASGTQLQKPPSQLNIDGRGSLPLLDTSAPPHNTGQNDAQQQSRTGGEGTRDFTDVQEALRRESRFRAEVNQGNGNQDSKVEEEEDDPSSPPRSPVFARIVEASASGGVIRPFGNTPGSRSADSLASRDSASAGAVSPLHRLNTPNSGSPQPGFSPSPVAQHQSHGGVASSRSSGKQASKQSIYRYSAPTSELRNSPVPPFAPDSPNSPNSPDSHPSPASAASASSPLSQYSVPDSIDLEDSTGVVDNDNDDTPSLVTSSVISTGSSRLRSRFQDSLTRSQEIAASDFAAPISNDITSQSPKQQYKNNSSPITSPAITSSTASSSLSPVNNTTAMLRQESNHATQSNPPSSSSSKKMASKSSKSGHYPIPPPPTAPPPASYLSPSAASSTINSRASNFATSVNANSNSNSPSSSSPVVDPIPETTHAQTKTSSASLDTRNRELSTQYSDFATASPPTLTSSYVSSPSASAQYSNDVHTQMQTQPHKMQLREVWKSLLEQKTQMFARAEFAWGKELQSFLSFCETQKNALMQEFDMEMQILLFQHQLSLATKQQEHQFELLKLERNHAAEVANEFHRHKENMILLNQAAKEKESVALPHPLPPSGPPTKSPKSPSRNHEPRAQVSPALVPLPPPLQLDDSSPELAYERSVSELQVESVRTSHERKMRKLQSAHNGHLNAVQQEQKELLERLHASCMEQYTGLRNLHENTVADLQKKQEETIGSIKKANEHALQEKARLFERYQLSEVNAQFLQLLEWRLEHGAEDPTESVLQDSSHVGNSDRKQSYPNDAQLSENVQVTLDSVSNRVNELLLEKTELESAVNQLRTEFTQQKIEFENEQANDEFSWAQERLTMQVQAVKSFIETQEQERVRLQNFLTENERIISQNQAKYSNLLNDIQKKGLSQVHKEQSRWIAAMEQERSRGEEVLILLNNQMEAIQSRVQHRVGKMLKRMSRGIDSFLTSQKEDFFHSLPPLSPLRLSGSIPLTNPNGLDAHPLDTLSHSNAFSVLSEDVSVQSLPPLSHSSDATDNATAFGAGLGSPQPQSISPAQAHALLQQERQLRRQRFVAEIQTLLQSTLQEALGQLFAEDRPGAIRQPLVNAVERTLQQALESALKSREKELEKEAKENETETGKKGEEDKKGEEQYSGKENKDAASDDLENGKTFRSEIIPQPTVSSISPISPELITSPDGETVVVRVSVLEDLNAMITAQEGKLRELRLRVARSSADLEALQREKSIADALCGEQEARIYELEDQCASLQSQVDMLQTELHRSKSLLAQSKKAQGATSPTIPIADNKEALSIASPSHTRSMQLQSNAQSKQTERADIDMEDLPPMSLEAARLFEVMSPEAKRIYLQTMRNQQSPADPSPSSTPASTSPTAKLPPLSPPFHKKSQPSFANAEADNTGASNTASSATPVQQVATAMLQGILLGDKVGHKDDPIETLDGAKADAIGSRAKDNDDGSLYPALAKIDPQRLFELSQTLNSLFASASNGSNTAVVSKKVDFSPDSLPSNSGTFPSEPSSSNAFSPKDDDASGPKLTAHAFTGLQTTPAASPFQGAPGANTSTAGGTTPPTPPFPLSLRSPSSPASPFSLLSPLTPYPSSVYANNPNALLSSISHWGGASAFPHAPSSTYPTPELYPAPYAAAAGAGTMLYKPWSSYFSLYPMAPTPVHIPTQGSVHPPPLSILGSPFSATTSSAGAAKEAVQITPVPRPVLPTPIVDPSAAAAHTHHAHTTHSPRGADSTRFLDSLHHPLSDTRDFTDPSGAFLLSSPPLSIYSNAFAASNTASGTHSHQPYPVPPPAPPSSSSLTHPQLDHRAHTLEELLHHWRSPDSAFSTFGVTPNGASPCGTLPAQAPAPGTDGDPLANTGRSYFEDVPPRGQENSAYISQRYASHNQPSDYHGYSHTSPYGDDRKRPYVPIHQHSTDLGDADDSDESNVQGVTRQSSVWSVDREESLFSPGLKMRLPKTDTGYAHPAEKGKSHNMHNAKYASTTVSAATAATLIAASGSKSAKQEAPKVRIDVQERSPIRFTSDILTHLAKSQKQEEASPAIGSAKTNRGVFLDVVGNDGREVQYKTLFTDDGSILLAPKRLTAIKSKGSTDSDATNSTEAIYLSRVEKGSELLAYSLSKQKEKKDATPNGRRSKEQGPWSETSPTLNETKLLSPLSAILQKAQRDKSSAATQQKKQDFSPLQRLKRSTEHKTDSGSSLSPLLNVLPPSSKSTNESLRAVGNLSPAAKKSLSNVYDEAKPEISPSQRRQMILMGENKSHPWLWVGEKLQKEDR